MKKQISVFIASPGDLANERRYFESAIRQLNVGFGDGAKVEFIPLGWEDTLAVTGRRSQGVINKEIDRADIFILAMYRRWGQIAPDANPYSSYTEEEFHRALVRWKKTGTPEIFVFFKRVDAESEADPGDHLRKVMDFRKQLEESRKILYHYFDDKNSFVNEVDKHLRAYVKGELPRADEQKDIVILPEAVLKEIEKAKKVAERKTKEALIARNKVLQANSKVEQRDLQLAVDAAQLSKEGKIEFARQKFQFLSVESTNLEVLNFAFEFFKRTGDIDSASKVIERWLSISGPDNNTVETAKGCGNLGILYQTRGELERAEEMFQKSLAINVTLGKKEGMASQYGNLGILYQTHGELERAEEMSKKSLAINKELGRKEGMASQYGNLGILYQTRGEFEQAEDMHYKSLAINEELGIKEGMASQYGNLGNLYYKGKDLERAEEMYHKSFAINEELGRKEGIANQYGDLANLYETRGELEHAEEMYKKSMAINEALGRKEGMASQYGNLGILYHKRGELERAKEMYLRSLAIEEALGRKEGMAYDYGNLGVLYQKLGEFEQAEKMYQQAVRMFKELRSPYTKIYSKQLEKLKNSYTKNEQSITSIKFSGLKSRATD